MGLTEERLWGLSPREYRALVEQWEQAQQRTAMHIAALRSDLYNTAGKSYSDPPAPADFLNGHLPGVEERALELIELGYSPSEAAALASSRQTSEHKLYVVNRACDVAHAKKGKRRTG